MGIIPVHGLQGGRATIIGSHVFLHDVLPIDLSVQRQLMLVVRSAVILQMQRRQTVAVLLLEGRYRAKN